MRGFYAVERLPWDETVVRRALDALWCEPLHGGAALHLEVDYDNPDGKRLYLRRGFVDHERHLMTKWLDR